jgi:hypothetical protein
MVFQKRDGSYYLAAWIEQSGYDVTTRAATAVPEVTIQITVPDSVRAVNTHRWQPDGTVIKTGVSPLGAIPLVIGDRLTVLELRGPVSVPALPTSVRVSPVY